MSLSLPYFLLTQTNYVWHWVSVVRFQIFISNYLQRKFWISRTISATCLFASWIRNYQIAVLHVSKWNTRLVALSISREFFEHRCTRYIYSSVYERRHPILHTSTMRIYAQARVNFLGIRTTLDLYSKLSIMYLAVQWKLLSFNRICN